MIGALQEVEEPLYDLQEFTPSQVLILILILILILHTLAIHLTFQLASPVLFLPRDLADGDGGQDVPEPLQDPLYPAPGQVGHPAGLAPTGHPGTHGSPCILHTPPAAPPWTYSKYLDISPTSRYSTATPTCTSTATPTYTSMVTPPPLPFPSPFTSPSPSTSSCTVSPGRAGGCRTS